MDSEEVIELLTQWELLDALPYLQARNISDTATLKLLQSDHSKVIFPVEQFGLALKFFNCLELWKTSKATESVKVTEVASTSNIPESMQVTPDVTDSVFTEDSADVPGTSSSEPAKKRQKLSVKPIESVASKAVSDLDIRSILDCNERGRAILDFYEANKFLGKSHRDVLVAIIVDALRNISHGLKNHDFERVSFKISDLFPSEDHKTYYIAPKSYDNNSPISIGKIPRRFRNQESRSKELRNPSSRASSTATLSSPTLSRKNPYDVVMKAVATPEMKEALLWLETDALTANDWTLLKKKWEISAPLRLQTYFKQKNDSAVADYINKYKLLKHPSGYTLLEVDFNCIHAGKEMILVQNWDTFVQKTLILAQTDVKDPVARDCLALAKSTQHPGSLAVLCLCILPALCPPTKRVESKDSQSKSKTNKESKEKVTIAKSRSSLFLHVTDLSNLPKELKERRANLSTSADKKDYQPFLIFVGPKLSDIKNSYVDIAGILYRLTTPSKAIDVCFKAIVALHLSFPQSA